MLYELGYVIGRKMVSDEPLREIFKIARLRSQLGPVLEELDKRNINLEKLAVNGTGSLVDVFHPDSRYTRVGMYKFLFDSDEEPKPGVLYVRGFRPRFLRKDMHFDVNVFILPHYYDPKDAKDKMIEYKRVEWFLQQRMTEQQPEYNYTYRTKTEIPRV